MNRVNATCVAVLIATAHRANLLANRALPSVARQSCAPRRVVVVDDARNAAAAEQTRQLVRSWQPAGIVVDFLRNRRTRGAAGTWNSGLDHLLRTGGDPQRLYVAILDDDDQWEPDPLERCLALAESRRLDMVAAPFLRIEEDAEPCPVIPPRSLRASSFLAGNPGIQGSTLVCRLSVLLEAGLFDESLPSCTDRDLCIRISELPDVRYGVTSHPTVHHFACRSRSRPRLSTPRSPARLAGLDGFFRKYRGRMSESERERFRTRARRLFGWKESLVGPVTTRTTRTAHDVSPALAPPDVQPSHDRPHLIVGMIIDTGRLEDVRGLLADLRDLAGNPGLSGLDVLAMENGHGRTADDALRALVAHERACGLRIHLVELPPQPLGHPTDTTQAWQRIPVVFTDEVLDALPDECVAVAVERVVEATPLPEFEHPERAMYLFGPENGSLDETMLERCTHVVSIPGHVCSNLAAAVNVVLYDRIAKRWGRERDAFPRCDALLRGVRGGYEARLDRDND